MSKRWKAMVCCVSTYLLPANCCSLRGKRERKKCHICLPLSLNYWLSFLKGFSKDVIKAFRNGFPSNWKAILGKEYGKQAASTASVGKERPTDKRIDTTGQNGHSALKRQGIPLAQPLRESVQHGKPVIQQGNQQLRQATQEGRQIVIEIAREDDSPHTIGEAPRRLAAAPVNRAPVRVSLASLPSQGSILAPPTNRIWSKDEAVETPVASTESLSEGSAVSKATTGITSKKPESIPESPPSNSLKGSAPTSAAPLTPSATSTPLLSTWVKVQEELTATGQLSTHRRASAPESVPLQDDTPALRRSSAPDQSITAMGTWKAAGPTTYGVDRPLDKALDGNLRMRSKAVVEQIRERTRQHPDLPLVVVDKAVED